MGVLDHTEEVPMKIKVCDENASKIEAALYQAVGGYSRHAFHSFTEVEALTRRAEARLEKALGTSPRAKQGALVGAISSEPVPNSYRYSRRGNVVGLQRGRDAWFLLLVESKRLWPRNGGEFELTLTPEQWDRAARRQAERIGFGMQPAREG